jgi:membrane-bound lytic murein transglycosylase
MTMLTHTTHTTTTPGELAPSVRGRLSSRAQCAIALSVCVATLALGVGCAPETAVRVEPTLLPPTVGAVETKGTAAIRWEAVDLSTFDLAGIFPGRDLAQRAGFIAACKNSQGSVDRQVAADAAALDEIFWAAKDGLSFEKFLRERCVASRASPSRFDAATQSSGLLTGYATPTVRVRRKADDRFRFPILGDLRMAHPQLADAPRAEILASSAARELALAWIDDPLGWALVETNGTAVLVIDEPNAPREEAYISRVSTNGRPFTSVGRGLAKEGLLDASKATLADVVRIAERDPAAIERAALENERVVFFAEVPRTSFPPVLGLPNGRLVPGYSCAADPKIYPAGSVLLLSERATRGVERRPVRVVFVHDAGGAISGTERIDVYFGEGSQAILRAGDMRIEVDVMRLSLRGAVSP